MHAFTRASSGTPIVNMSLMVGSSPCLVSHHTGTNNKYMGIRRS